MKRILIAVLICLFSVSAFAQSQAVGFLIGTADALDSDLDFDFEPSVVEIFYSTKLEMGTEVKIRLGRVETDQQEFLDQYESIGDVTIEYVDLLVQYHFDELFGSTTIFAGPGAYTIDHDNGDESDFGFSAGVGARFPVTRRTSILAEAAYHWANFENDLDFVNFNVGVRFGF